MASVARLPLQERSPPRRLLHRPSRHLLSRYALCCPYACLLIARRMQPFRRVRMSKSQFYLSECAQVAAKSPMCFKLGAVLVKGGKVISTGYNHHRPHYDGLEVRKHGHRKPVSMHAEMHAIFNATGMSPSFKAQVQGAERCFTPCLSGATGPTTYQKPKVDNPHNRAKVAAAAAAASSSPSSRFEHISKGCYPLERQLPEVWYGEVGEEAEEEEEEEDLPSSSPAVQRHRNRGV